MSRPTEDDQASSLLNNLMTRGFRVCELVPTHVEGYERFPEKWSPLDDKHAVRILAQLILELP